MPSSGVAIDQKSSVKWPTSSSSMQNFFSHYINSIQIALSQKKAKKVSLAIFLSKLPKLILKTFK